MFDVGFPELILVSVIALLVLGPERLPEALRTLGLWLGRLRRSFTTVKEKSVEELAEYFARRWRVELYFDDTKTSGAMDVLRTKSPELICRELLMHMIAYNLVRAAAMAGGATARAKGGQAALDRVSYKGTADRIATWSTVIWP